MAGRTTKFRNLNGGYFSPLYVEKSNNNASNFTVLDSWVFENFILKLNNNNLCQKLASSIESPTKFDEIF